MDDSVLRDHLVKLLRGGDASVTADKALVDIKPPSRNVRLAEGLHSIWEELEHMRIAQEDILRYAIEAKWESPKFPDGYWPTRNTVGSEEMWSASEQGFFADREKVIGLVKNTSIDLTAKIPHGEWRTYLRQILLVADHNAYHLGQIVQTRKALGDWAG